MKIPDLEEYNSLKDMMRYNSHALTVHSVQRYPNLYYFLNRGDNERYHARYPAFARTVYGTIEFLKNLETYYYEDGIVAFISSWTAFKVIRKGKGTILIANRYMNFMSALGLFPRLSNEDSWRIQRWWRHEIGQRLVNAYVIRAWTDEVLEECDAAAARLRAAGVTPGNIGYAMLCCNGLEDIGNKVFTNTDPMVQDNWEYKFLEMTDAIDSLLEQKGYCTREEVRANCHFTTDVIDNLFRIFRPRIKERYRYKRPSREEKQTFGLDSEGFILVRRS